MDKSVLTKEQKREFHKDIEVDGVPGRIEVVASFDDARGNGHNTFAITGRVYKGDKCISSGHIDDDIAEHFPELAHMLKWHLCTSESIWNYPGGVLRHAADRTHLDYNIGEPVKFDTHIEFFNHPYKFSRNANQDFLDYLEKVECFSDVDVVEVPHYNKGKKNMYQYPSMWSLSGFRLPAGKEWANAPFCILNDANEFLSALRTSDYQLIEVPIDWCESLEPNIEKAKEIAMWPNATPEELRDKYALLERVPDLMWQFQVELAELDFTY